ncbi:MAG: hypothetical protein ACREFE_12775 [Limisphaerales bacterium]
MSEFKYACPVCGQHIKCDSSQSGSVMECPTCFQKIIAPNAPATDDPKFILTGTKVGERPPPSVPANSEPTAAPIKSFPGTAIILVIFLCIAVVVGFIYHGTIFKSNPSTNTAGGTNWTLALDAVTIPESPAAGRIHGQTFICERAIFQNGALTLRGAAGLSAAINLSGAQPETLAGQFINVATNAEAAARVTLRWKSDGHSAKENFNDGYALRLEFGQSAKNRLPGKIYFCAPDEMKSYIAGTFKAEIRKSKPKKK